MATQDVLLWMEGEEAYAVGASDRGREFLNESGRKLVPDLEYFLDTIPHHLTIGLIDRETLSTITGKSELH